ncbi:colanic acid biosynthesis glycosyltransferase WcaA [Scandinavium goeteborgense]|uniref:colanic acid biosynthesis glycosyltransferase WcaA n=1 Tax=Scandinavium goeteborgense TaxID=1851514 RepID=UPI00249543B2|nr:colanic acid biosynthesis glycosyltransferase WcaA [Scandinavium goeteborgense]
MQSLPLVSIYMPTWNREELAVRAIKSVINQTYQKWELIIVDDCSPSYKALNAYIEGLYEPRVTYIRNTENTGACAVRNQAIRLAQGELITGIDDDDEWLPERLELFVSYQDKLTEHAFLYAGDYICDSTDSLNEKNEVRVYPKPGYDRVLFDKKNIVGNQMLTLTSRLRSVLFDTNLTAAQDYDAFYRLAKYYGDPLKLNHVTQILYVNHGEARITASSKKFSGYLGFYRKHKKSFDTSSKKYQLFTLYYIRNKRMSFHTLMKLCSLRNLKRYVMMHTRFRIKKF